MTIAIASGGMDSTTLLYQMKREGLDPIVLSFDYGQKHRKELDFCKATCDALGFEHRVVDLTSITGLIGTSALTSSDAVPEGHYAEDNMRATVVPNRNMMMLTIAAAAAISNNSSEVWIGVHAGDHFVYPDCRPESMAAIQSAIRIANDGFINQDFRLRHPFIDKTKTDIAEIGHNLGVLWAETWSCYKGAEHHCGRCGTCVERREAFRDAGVGDPTTYDDYDFAWQALAEAGN